MAGSIERSEGEGKKHKSIDKREDGEGFSHVIAVADASALPHLHSHIRSLLVRGPSLTRKGKDQAHQGEAAARGCQGQQGTDKSKTQIKTAETSKTAPVDLHSSGTC